MALKDIRLPNASADLVAIFGEGFNQVFELARPMRNTVAISKRLMEHPVEDGSTITDHQVILPVQIELTLMLSGENSRNVFNQIYQAFLSGTILTVQGKTDTYENMVITDVPYEEKTEMFNSVSLFVRLSQITFVEAQYQKLPPRQVAQQKNSDTKDAGQKQTTEVQSPSLLKRGKDGVANFYSKGKTDESD